MPTEHGLVWAADPDVPDSISRDLYSGSPGVILFMLEMRRATGNRKCLELAAGVGLLLLQVHAHESERAFELRFPDSR